MQPSSTTIEFIKAERAEAERRQREHAKVIDRMAAAPTLEEQQRIADQWWTERIERPRATRRVQTARTATPPAPTLQPRPVATPREHRAASSSSSSGQDPGDDSDPHQPSRLDTQAEIDRWLDERKRTLGALTNGDQLRFDEEVES